MWFWGIWHAKQKVAKHLASIQYPLYFSIEAQLKSDPPEGSPGDQLVYLTRDLLFWLIHTPSSSMSEDPIHVTCKELAKHSWNVEDILKSSKFSSSLTGVKRCRPRLFWQKVVASWYERNRGNTMKDLLLFLVQIDSKGTSTWGTLDISNLLCEVIISPFTFLLQSAIALISDALRDLDHTFICQKEILRKDKKDKKR